MDDADVERALDDGLWDAAVERWREESDVDEDDLALVEEIGLFDDFDFFWDADVDRVGYESPGLPRDWENEAYADDVEGWSQVSRINMAIDELGQTARELVEDELGVGP
jgi:hypothetical protein